MTLQCTASRELADALTDLRTHLDDIVMGLRALPLLRAEGLQDAESFCSRLEAVLTEAEKTVLAPNPLDFPSPSNISH